MSARARTPETSLPRLFAGGRGLRFARLAGEGLLQAGATIATALLVRRIFDGWIGTEAAWRSAELAGLGAGLAGLAVLLGLARALERADAERLGQDYILEVRLQMFDRLAALGPRPLERRRRGAILLRFVNDLTPLRQWVSLGLARLREALEGSL